MLGKQAGQLAMDSRKKLDRIKTQTKVDGTKVSEVDLQLHQLLTTGLRRMMPAMRVISEEDPKVFEQSQPWQKFWLVDPLDGTSSYLSGSDEFCINVAYMQDNQPVLGMVVAPALGKLIYGGPNYGVYVNGELQARPNSTAALRVVHSYDEDLQAPWVNQVQSLGLSLDWLTLASSLKLAYLALGEAELYPRQGELMEWDIAAPLALLRAQHGDLKHWDGSEVTFNKPGWKVPGFCAAQDPRQLKALGL